MLVATFEADWVVGLGGAFAPVEVREVLYSTQYVRHPRLWYAYGIYVRVAPKLCPAPLLRTAHT